MTSLAVVILIVLRLVEAIHSAPLPNNQGTRETGSNEEWPSGRFDTDFFDDTVVVTFVNSCRGSEQKVNISSTQKDCINLTKSDSRVVEIKIEPFDFISLTVFDQEGCNGVGFSINKSSHSLVSGNPASFTPASFKINRR